MRRGRKPKSKVRIFATERETQQWLAENSQGLITCPNQPGNLKITPASCAKRHEFANDPQWSNVGKEPFHVFVFKMNLKACRDCEIGAMNSARQDKAA
jgi:hypothetical protein